MAATEWLLLPSPGALRRPPRRSRAPRWAPCRVLGGEPEDAVQASEPSPCPQADLRGQLDVGREEEHAQPML